MLKVLLSACLLLTPLASASYVFCRSAFNGTGMTADAYAQKLCNTKTDPCSSTVLRTTITSKKPAPYHHLNKYLDIPEVQVEKTCTPSDYCHTGDYSATATNNKYFQMKFYCCETELCNNATLSLPDRSMMRENGLQCPACYTLGHKVCKTEKTINCLENETQCVYFKGIISKDFWFQTYFNFKGCGTTDFCGLFKRPGTLFGGGKFGMSIYEERCYNASPISHQPEHGINGTV